MASAPAIGPEPNEFADFEQACLPRRQPFRLGRFLNLISAAAVIFLVAALAITFLQGFKTNSSDHLILGTWRSIDHPHFSTMQFTKSGHLIVTDKTRRGLSGSYRFLAQYTIEFKVYDGREPIQEWKVRLSKAEMTTTDTTDGAISHWRRQ